jgi:predicted Holliday junction resolvase-like endonuclease
METLKRWASPQNITIVAVIMFLAIIGISYYRQIKPIKSLEEQIEITEKAIDSTQQQAKQNIQKANQSEEQRIQNNNFIDVLPNDELQNAIDSAFVE